MLVSGIYAGGRSFLPFKKFLEKNGWSVSLAPEQKNCELVEILARKLQKRIAEIPAKRVQIVTHSMGGITVLCALQNSKIFKKVEQVITLGSPLRGCALGDLAFWEKKKNQKWLARNSVELAKLTASPKINRKIISLRAEFDEIVFPAKVSILLDARENSEIKIIRHAGLILAKKSWREIVRRLLK